MLPSFAANDPETIRRAFQNAATLPLHQSWREMPEKNFLPGTVRVGWRAEQLLVFAELEDEDIFNNATGHDQQMWMLGDTFEMFLRPVEQRGYFELHVTPSNHRLQLRYLAAPVRRGDGAWELVRVRCELFRSRTWLRPETNRWFVYAEIPSASIVERARPLVGSCWKISFGRYDYSRNRVRPIISSTSDHAAPDFHRQQEWTLINFES